MRHLRWWICCLFALAALATTAPRTASAESIIDLVAPPELAQYPANFVFPSDRCKTKCDKYLKALNDLRNELNKFDTAEWKDWWKANLEAKAAEEAFKTADDAAKAGQGDLTKATDDLTAADSALTTANKAIGPAKTALGKAKTAATTADEKVTTADKALTKAQGDLAKNKKGAQEAVTKATTNLQNAKAAQTTAQNAQTAAQTAADTAQANIDTAKAKQTEAKAKLAEAQKPGQAAKDANTAKTKAANKLKDKEGKLPKDKANEPKQKDKLADLVKKIPSAINDLKDCLDNCDLPDPNITVKLPNCWANQKDKEDKLEEIAQALVRWRQQGGVNENPTEAQKQARANVFYLLAIRERITNPNHKNYIKPCGPGGMNIPGPTAGQGYFVTFSGDGEKWCNYADGEPIRAWVTFADDVGNPVTEQVPVMREPPPGEPVTPPTTPPARTAEPTPPIMTPEKTPTPIKTAEVPPLTTAEKIPEKTPEKTPEKPTDPPPPTKKPEDPPTQVTEQVPPPKQPDEPQIPDTVFVKAKESVLEEAAKTVGKEIQGQTVKLLPTEKPELPKQGEPRIAQDRGFDKPPSQCTTGADGTCKISTAPDDRALFGLPTRAGAPKQNYRVDVDVRTTTGAVVETTKRPQPVLTGLGAGVFAVANEFKIGNRTFARLAAHTDAGVKPPLREKFDRPGAGYEEDTCRDKQPGPPLGMEAGNFTPIAVELPATQVHLKRLARGAGVRR